MARDEAEILRTELSEELRRNAEMQQRITSLELANLETAKLVPTAAAVEADEEERQRAEREVRDARRTAAVARGETDDLAKELASTQRQLDQLQLQHDRLQDLHAAGIARASAEDAARVAALRGEVETLRRFAELASGAQRFARWRIWVTAMQRKRAEYHAAIAHAARRPAIATPELVERLRWLLGYARQRALSALTGAPREMCTRALWRWRTAVLAKVGIDLASVAAVVDTAATAPAVEAADRSEAAATLARDDALWARESTKRASDAEGMLHEAIAVGDAQTRRVLQLQRAVGSTRRTLAACLLRSHLSAGGRAACARALHRWALAVSAHVKQRAMLDAKTARDDANRARDNAKASESFAKDAQEAAAREVANVKKRLAVAERSRGTLRDQVSSLSSELETERREHESTREEYAHKLDVMGRARSVHESRSHRLEVVQGERMELESQLRLLRQKLRQSAMLLPTSCSLAVPADGGAAAPVGSPSLSPPIGSAVYTSGRRLSTGMDEGAARRTEARAEREATAELKAKLKTLMREKEQALTLRTQAVRDLKATKEALRCCEDQLHEAQRHAALGRLLAHARSRIGRPAQQLRLLAALRDWIAACRAMNETAWLATEGAPRAAWATPATAGARGRKAAPPPRGWTMMLRASRLGELRVRVQNRALTWSLRARYGALLQWRELALMLRTLKVDGSASTGEDERLQALLNEVSEMKAAVRASSGLARAAPPLVCSGSGGEPWALAVA